MADREPKQGLFPALLKHWRHQRGLSQLDLAIAADVSSRHVSFLETGRSAPTEQMVLQLATTLDVPLRHVNTLLRAADLPAAYVESPLADGLPEGLRGAVDLLKRHQEPFPLIVIDRHYRVLDLNEAAATLLSAALPPPADDQELALNLAEVTFDPDGAMPLLVNFDQVGRELLWRLQREAMADPDDHQMRSLIDRILAFETVPENWRRVDLGHDSEPFLILHLRLGDVDLRFTTLVTSFQAPQNIAADEIRIESWFPADADTEQFCDNLAG